MHVGMMSGEFANNDISVRKVKPIPLQENISDYLPDRFASLSVKNKSPQDVLNSKSNCHSSREISPSNFITFQRLCSSALECRKNTTMKSSRNGGILFDDLINTNVTRKNKIKYGTEAKNEDIKDNLSENFATSGASKSAEFEGCSKATIEKKWKEKSIALLARGPLPCVFSTTTDNPTHTVENGCATMSQISSPKNYNLLCNQCQYGSANRNFPTSSDFLNIASKSSTPDTVQSDFDYNSTSLQHQASSNVQQITLLSKNVLGSTQLPEDLSDFILKYSQEYTTTVSSPESDIAVRSRDSSISDGYIQSNFDSPLYRILVEDDCVSPLSAKTAPQCSPVLPRTATQVPMIFEKNCDGMDWRLKTTVSTSKVAMESLINSRDGRKRTIRYAKNRLRAFISDSEMSEAWAWTCKCIQEAEGALCYQDPDGDSLLHIVILHLDFAKIYALVEQMLKSEDLYTRQAFDIPNKVQETPLHLAVLKNSPEVVAYLLEAGANPNSQTAAPAQETPLHYAAMNGMASIAEIICSNGIANVNIPNGMGQTPLLCAVREHGVKGKKPKFYTDSESTVRCLLRHGANPLWTDSNENSILHYAAESLDADLIEMLKSCLDGETVTKLANKENAGGKTPLEILGCESEQDGGRLRSNVFISLLRCGATVNYN